MYINTDICVVLLSLQVQSVSKNIEQARKQNNDQIRLVKSNSLLRIVYKVWIQHPIAVATAFVVLRSSGIVQSAHVCPNKTSSVSAPNANPATPM
jgi:hypothetical protein